MNKFYYICFTLILTSFKVYAYDWDKCSRAWVSQPGSHLVAATSMSSIQFMSSWGACSAVGIPEDSLKSFYNDNYWLIKRDFAKDDGEFKDVFLSFFKCSVEENRSVTKVIRNNYEKIFEPNLTGVAVVLSDESIEASFMRMRSHLINNRNSYKSCDLLVLENK